MQTNILQAGQKQLTSSHGVASVFRDVANGEYALLAAKGFEVNEVICPFSADKILSAASYLTIQTGADTHITLEPSFLQYTNHSCDPNVFFDTQKMLFIAIKKVAAGDELRFFYPATEWEMAAPFVCNCGDTDCLQLINGAAHLSFATLSRYRLTAFIQNLSSKKYPAQ